MVVQQSFQNTGFQVLRTDLGEVGVADDFQSNQMKQVGDLLHSFGFELLEDKSGKMAEKIKNAIVELIQSRIYVPKTNYSAYLSEELKHERYQ